MFLHLPASLETGQIESDLAALLAQSRIGEFDGTDISGDEKILYLYGRNAEQIFELIEPTLRSEDAYHGGWAQLRFGPPGSPYRKVSF